jgi:iron complex transport system substrate-binding protein
MTTLNTLPRRRLLAGGAGAVALLGLAACGSDGSGASDTTSTSKPTARTVESAKGSITVPADPQRIVALAPQVRSTLYDLGITPAGVYNEGDQYISPRYRSKLQASATIGSGGELDLEKVAAAAPDLIIGVDYSWNTDLYTKLSQIAPTVITATDTWQTVSEGTAAAVGRTADLKALQARFSARADEIASTFASELAAQKWDILQGGFDDGKFWLYGPKSDAGAILAAAGVQFASASTGVTGVDNEAVSYENLETLADADVIGYYANYDGTPTNNGPQLFKQTGFKSLAAVKAGRTVAFPDFLPGGYGDAIAVLDQLHTGLTRLQSAR